MRAGWTRVPGAASSKPRSCGQSRSTARPSLLRMREAGAAAAYTALQFTPRSGRSRVLESRLPSGTALLARLGLKQQAGESAVPLG